MCDFRLGLNGKVVITLDFLGEIYSSAAKSLDFMRVCESVVMNIGTKAFKPVLFLPVKRSGLLFFSMRLRSKRKMTGYGF